MVKRPILVYPGGKWRDAPWILTHFPAHSTYLEPFGGAASVLLRKARSDLEVYNDIDGDLVNLFRVLRSPEMAAELKRVVYLTPYARQEYEVAQAYDGNDPIERARLYLLRSFAGYIRKHANTGFRTKPCRGNVPARTWAGWPARIDPVVERLRGVVIENRPAIEVMRRYDDRDSLMYVDPPYVPKTDGSRRNLYPFELSAADHREIILFLTQCKSMVVLSGYNDGNYGDLFESEGWQRVDKVSRMQTGQRTESLWLSPNIKIGSGW